MPRHSRMLQVPSAHQEDERGDQADADHGSPDLGRRRRRGNVAAEGAVDGSPRSCRCPPPTPLSLFTPYGLGLLLVISGVGAGECPRKLAVYVGWTLNSEYLMKSESCSRSPSG